MNTTNTSDLAKDTIEIAPEYPIPVWLYYVIGFGLLSVFFLGTFMNGTGLIVFIKNKHLRSPTNTFIISLLLGDFLMSLGTIISMVANFARSYVWGFNVCVFEGFWMYLIGLTNMHTLMAISFDRYFVIAKPLSASKITNRVAFLAVFIVWIQGLCWASFPFFGWGMYAYEVARTSCSVLWDTTDPKIYSYNIAIFLWSLCLPLCVISFSYYQVYMTIKHVARNGVWDMNSRIARRNLRVERKMFKTIVLMLCAFLGCWSPYAIVSFWAMTGNAKSIPVIITTIPAMVAKTACIWDPIIYVATNKQFRTSFYNTLPCSGLAESLMKKEEEKDKDASDDEDEEKAPTANDKSAPVRKVTTVAPLTEDVGEETQVEDIGKTTNDNAGATSSNV